MAGARRGRRASRCAAAANRGRAVRRRPRRPRRSTAARARRSPPASASSIASSATVRPSAPRCELLEEDLAGRPGRHPAERRAKAETLFQPAGLRSEPIMSLPSATGSMRVASATAAPPSAAGRTARGRRRSAWCRRPGCRCASRGRTPACWSCRSGSRPPASARSTMIESAFGTFRASIGEPMVVGMPAVAGQVLRRLREAVQPARAAARAPGRHRAASPRRSSASRVAAARRWRSPPGSPPRSGRDRPSSPRRTRPRARGSPRRAPGRRAPSPRPGAEAPSPQARRTMAPVSASKTCRLPGRTGRSIVSPIPRLKALSRRVRTIAPPASS